MSSLWSHLLSSDEVTYTAEKRDNTDNPHLTQPQRGREGGRREGRREGGRTEERGGEKHLTILRPGLRVCSTADWPWLYLSPVSMFLQPGLKTTSGASGLDHKSEKTWRMRRGSGHWVWEPAPLPITSEHAQSRGKCGACA